MLRTTVSSGGWPFSLAVRADDISVTTPGGTAGGVSYGTQSGIWPWPDHVGICSASPGSTWLRFERMPFIPRLKAWGFLAWLYKTAIRIFLKL